MSKLQSSIPSWPVLIVYTIYDYFLSMVLKPGTTAIMKAKEFNGQFSDVFTKSEYKQVPLLDRSAPFMHDIVVTKEGVTKLLKGLNPSKALGPDELHPRVLKELAMELGPVFASQFIQVKFLKNGLLLIFAPCLRRVTGHLPAITALFL